MDYRELLVNVILNGDYALSDMEHRIDKLWIEGKITDGDREELMPMAAAHAREDRQLDVVEKIVDLEHRVYDLEHPVDQFAIWEPGYQTKKGETVRFDVTGDGELDLCRYDGGRDYTGLSIGKIEGWHLVDREGNATHDISRDVSGGYVLTPIDVEPEPEPEPDPEPEPEPESQPE